MVKYKSSVIIKRKNYKLFACQKNMISLSEETARLFRTSPTKALDSLRSAVYGLKARNDGFDCTAWEIATLYTKGQLQVIHSFGGLYGMHQETIKANITPYVVIETPNPHGLLIHTPRELIIKNNRLTDKAKEISGVLTQDLEGLGRNELVAVMYCLGLGNMPDAEKNAALMVEISGSHRRLGKERCVVA